MLADQADNALISALLYWLLAGGIVWMWLYARGKLDGVYVSPVVGPDALDVCANVMITAVLIAGWPVTAIVVIPRSGGSLPSEPAPVVNCSLPSGESDLAVTPGCAGAGAISSRELRAARESLLASEGLSFYADDGERA